MSKIVHCCIDLELEQPKTNHQCPDSKLDIEKIIQVGYVIYQLNPEFKVIEQVSRFVNIGVPLCKFIKSLTGIKQSQIDSGTTLVNIYNELVDKREEYKFSRVIKQWGGGDIECLKLELPNMEWQFGRSGCNIKHLYQIYAEANGISSSGGLFKSMAKCGLDWQGGQKHDASWDAYNTAYFHSFLYNKLKEEK